ncbi:MAG: hypothetical protein M3Y48_15180 [Actinomycetota bacterium]|nr:hypothetical protein [Actinomycetota bacterium]
MTSSGRTVDETSHRLVCDLLRGVLRRAAQTGPGAVDGVGSLLYRVSAVLYMLLLDHPIDRRGRCRSCRRPGAMIGLRRRRCLIHLRASYWLLRQPDKTLLFSRLADDLGPGTPSETRAGRPDLTHGAPGEPSDSRSRRVSPPDRQPPTPERSLVITGGMPWPR